MTLGPWWFQPNKGTRIIQRKRSRSERTDHITHRVAVINTAVRASSIFSVFLNSWKWTRAFSFTALVETGLAKPPQIHPSRDLPNLQPPA